MQWTFVKLNILEHFRAISTKKTTNRENNIETHEIKLTKSISSVIANSSKHEAVFILLLS
jgi:hypothetical protein